MVVFYYLDIFILLRPNQDSTFLVKNEHPMPDCRLVNHFPTTNSANLSISSPGQSYYQPFHNARNNVDASVNDNVSVHFSLKMFLAPAT